MDEKISTALFLNHFISTKFHFFPSHEKSKSFFYMFVKNTAMKKLLLFPLLAVFTTFVARAQDPATATESATGLRMGFHAGVNTSKFATEISGDSTDVSARIGWQAGVMLRYGNRFFAETHLELGQSTVDLITPDTGLVNIDSKVYRNYITIPVMLGYKLFQSPDGSSSFRIMGGGEAMAILKTKIDENLFYFTEDDFEPFSWAVYGGIGADLWIIRLDLGLHYGLTPMLQNDDESRNVMTTFNIGITF